MLNHEIVSEKTFVLNARKVRTMTQMMARKMRMARTKQKAVKNRISSLRLFGFPIVLRLKINTNVLPGKE